MKGSPTNSGGCDAGGVVGLVFVFSGRAEEFGPTGFLHGRENASPAANELMFRDSIDVEAFRRWR